MSLGKRGNLDASFGHEKPQSQKRRSSSGRSTDVVPKSPLIGIKGKLKFELAALPPSKPDLFTLADPAPNAVYNKAMYDAVMEDSMKVAIS
jgi:hypothetical protein